MNECKRKFSRSKLMAWVLIFLAFFLSLYSLKKEIEGAAISFWSVTVPVAVALYANKQYQDRKIIEIEKKNNQNREE